MIELRDVFFRYREGEFELRIPELRIARGDHVAVIGPSGSGKTTLLHLVAGIVPPERGVIEVDGVEITAIGDAARRDFRIRQFGLVFQEFALLEHLSVLDNVTLPYRISPSLRLGDEVRRRAHHLIEQVGIAGQANRLVTRLSQGRQKTRACSLGT